MNSGTIQLLCATVLLTRLAGAETNEPANDWKAATSNQDGKEYPQVNSEGRVKFRIAAPEAKTAGCTFRDSSVFTKGADGAWYGYTRPLDEGFHYYTIKIDGAEVPDPNSKMFFGAMRWGSAVEIPAKDQDFYALKNVPHGQLREIYFGSRSTESVRRAFVYIERPAIARCGWSAIVRKVASTYGISSSTSTVSNGLMSKFLRPPGAPGLVSFVIP